MQIDWGPRDELALESFSSYPYGRHKGVYYLVATGPEAINEELREWSQGNHPTVKLPGVRQRAELALSRWRNETLDPQPILFWVVQSRPGREPTTLALDFYDEDLDVIGFGVSERLIKADGTEETRHEEYPVFQHAGPWRDILHTVFVPISIRDAGQRADIQRWARYADGSGLSSGVPTSREDWEATLPPLWVSRPEPNVVEVQVYLYDRAGHKSDPVPLPAPPPNDQVGTRYRDSR